MGGKDAENPREVTPGFSLQGSETSDEVQGLEDNVDGNVSILGLALILPIPSGGRYTVTAVGDR